MRGRTTEQSMVRRVGHAVRARISLKKKAVAGLPSSGFRRLGGRRVSDRSLVQSRLDGGLGRSAQVNAQCALLASDAVNGSLGDQVAVKLNGTRGVVIAGDREVDLVRVAVGVDD